MLRESLLVEFGDVARGVGALPNSGVPIRIVLARGIHDCLGPDRVLMRSYAKLHGRES